MTTQEGILPPGEAAFNKIYGKYKSASKAKSREFKLTKSQFKKLITQNCYYCGQPPSQVTFNRRKLDSTSITHGGIDRLDSSQGYTIKNCVPCCKICNMFKIDRGKEDFLKRIEKIYLHIFDNKDQP